MKNEHSWLQCITPPFLAITDTLVMFSVYKLFTEPMHIVFRLFPLFSIVVVIGYINILRIAELKEELENIKHSCLGLFIFSIILAITIVIIGFLYLLHIT